MSVKQIFNTSAELDYPTVLPTLDLDFANSKTLDPRITFTRSSGGSYVGADGLIKLAGVNEARFDHDPVTGESLGLLVEESRTNLVTYSEDYSINTTTINASITTNVINAPDGTLTADMITASAGSAQHGPSKNTTGLPINSVCSLSVFVKAGTHNFCRVDSANITNWSTNAGVSVNLTNGSIIFGSGTVEPYPNGWYRITIYPTSNSTAGASRGMWVWVVGPGEETSIYDAVGTETIHVWGAQLEQGSFPTSYIPTEASTRTRAADDASITGKNFSDFYNPVEGTIFSNINFYAANNNVAAGYKITQGTNLRGLGVQYSASITSFMARTVASGFYAIEGPAYSKKVAGRYKIGYSVDASIDGSVPVSSFSTSDPVFGTENQMDIGGARNLSGSNNKFNGTINRLTYYPKRLPNSNLQTLTS